MKNFRDHIYLFKDKLLRQEPFAFARYSDGELYILQNKELKLDENLIQIGSNKSSGPYKQEDFKHFNPNDHAWFRHKLIEAYQYKQKDYYKGISCKCCVGNDNFEYQINLHGEDDEYLTWANLFVNGNYPFFIEEILPILQTYDTIMVCNEKASLNKLEFIVKDFRVGYNAMINDYSTITKIRSWILDNNISNHLFLFSASTFSNLAIYELFKEFPNNTFLDIGTCLTPYMDMPTDRHYLQEYWFDLPKRDLIKECIW